MKKKLLGILVLFSLTQTAALAAHDKNHITFINQTKHKVKFTVDVKLDVKHGLVDPHNLSKTLHSHTANYINVDQDQEACTYKEDGKIHKRKFKINIDIGDDGSVDHTAHRHCGENLYIWYEGDTFKENDEPHVKADLSGCDTDKSKPAILFAHGYNDNQKAFKTFSKHAEDKGWRVFRTSVPEDGSISKRAHRLNAYLEKAADQCNIGDGTLRVVAHSMGGLDVRYLVSKKLTSAKLFENIYTISTPHQGDSLGYLAAAGSDAARDLTPSHMKTFNKDHPYSSFKADGNQINLLALRFKCGKKGNSDGVVGVNNQIYPGAPYTKDIFKARHAESAKNCPGVINELDLTNLLQKILDDGRQGKDKFCTEFETETIQVL